MSSDMPDNERDGELRRMLVATASAAPERPRRRWSISGPIAAFALAGALTGAVSAAALTASGQRPPATLDDPVTLINMTDFVSDDTRLFGEPVKLDGQSDATVSVGAPPEGATEIALALRCVDTGTFEVTIDGMDPFTVICDEGSSARAGTAGFFSVEGGVTHTVTVAADEGDRFLLWASWAARAVPPEASPEQAAALADGEVTEAEYRAQFDRYAACMEAAGYPVSVSTSPGPIIRYTNSSAAVSSGAEGECYAREFGQVDMLWQGAHQSDEEGR